MGLKGKFLGERSGSAVFGSKSKPEWKPIYPSPQFDLHTLQAGEYYDLDLEDNRLVRATKLPPMGGARAQSFGPETSAFSNPQHVSAPLQASAPRETVPLNGMMASATGIAKSLIECGEPYEVAGRMALHWAALWGEAPAWKSIPHQEITTDRVQLRPAPTAVPAEPKELNDDVPF